MRFQTRPIVIACSLALGATGTARADQITDLQAKLEALQRQVQELQAQIGSVKQAQESQKPPTPAPAVAMKPGKDLVFEVGGGEIQVYGHVDVSLDNQTNGMAGFINGGQPVTGRNGWVPDVSSNLSYFGIRGGRPIGDDLRAVFQLESEVAFAATPGASDQSTDGTAQKYALGSRNTFIGLQSKAWGAIKLGKSDTPYKSSTGRMDPFASTPGDYNAIIGNSGGDNRAEFDARFAHAIWYESPKMGGLGFGAMVSPGQNRSTDSGLYAMGEPDCTGGNSTAGLNGNNGQPNPCEDGSFGNAFSAALTYEAGPLYVVAGYELHKNVNRKGDEIDAGTIGVRDEMAYKVGVQYTLPTHTTLDFIVERLKRDAITAALDERTHTATWLALTQHLSPHDELSLGWAHAGRTPGQPEAGVQDRNGNDAPAGSSKNGANLYSIGFKHRFFDNRTSTYLTFSRLKNEYWGHYSLGAGGHGLPTRNYVGDKFVGGCLDGGNCGAPFAGNTAQAVSVGLTYDY